jgi:replication factor A1
MSNLVEEIKAELLTVGVTAKNDEIESLVKMLVDFNVIEDEIKTTVFNQLVKKYKPGEKIKHGAAPMLKLSEITKNKQSATVKVKFLEEFDNSNESIRQVGIVGDESGTMKLTVWKDCKSDILLEIGKSYEIRSAYSNEFNKRMSIQAGKFSTITTLPDDIAAMSTEPEYTGALVSVIKDSGLISRCKAEVERNGKKVPCNKVLEKSICKEHGRQKESLLDMRVKAVIDTGKQAQTIIMNADIIEKVTGMTLKLAKQMAEDATDRGVVEDELKTRLTGKYFYVKGRVSNDYLFVSDMKLVEKLPVDYDALMRRVMAL